MAQTVRDVFESLTPCLGTQSEIKARATWVNVHSAHQSQSCPGRVAGLRWELDIPGPPRTGTVVCGRGAWGSGSLCCPWPSPASQGTQTRIRAGGRGRVRESQWGPTPDSHGPGTSHFLETGQEQPRTYFLSLLLARYPLLSLREKKKKQKEKVTLKTQVKPPLV